jgi:hypothetical protein
VYQRLSVSIFAHLLAPSNINCLSKLLMRSEAHIGVASARRVAEPAVVFGGQGGVASTADCLQVIPSIVVTIAVDVIDHVCCAQDALHCAPPARRLLTQNVGTNPTPGRAVRWQRTTLLTLAL